MQRKIIQWIHLDRDRARLESPYATTVAHGFLSLSLLSYLLGQALEIRSGFRMAVNYGLNRVRFPAPVFSDSKVRARFTLQSMSKVVDGYQAVFFVGSWKLKLTGSSVAWRNGCFVTIRKSRV